jgi:ankyrin repeat protein
MNGFRLDRRRDAMRGGSAGAAVIGPGNSAGSRLYLRLTGDRFGPQMPPTGALRAEQIETIKNWIDQGAEWPDALANDAAAVPADPGAMQIIDAIRQGDNGALTSAITSNAPAINAKGTGGATPLMWAALDGDIQTMRLLVERGADSNLANEAGATALMWAIPDRDKVALLLEKGANPNARSRDGRTALLIAAGIRGAADIVKLLLDNGASLAEAAPSLFGPITALSEAAIAGDEATFRLLIERGLQPKMDAPVALAFAMRANCASCVEMLLKGMPPPLLSVVAALSSPPLGDARAVKFLLDHGADANARDLEGRTLLMLAASSDQIPLETVQALLAKGADVNLTSPKGETALALARLRGQTAVLDALMKAGARDVHAGAAATPTPAPAGSVRQAIERSVPLLQKTDVTFLRKSGCVSCHNNTLTAMTVAAVRTRGIAVDEAIARDQKSRIGSFLESWRERTLQGVGIPGNADTVSYILLGLAAEHYPADAATDAMARFLLHQQSADGRWQLLAHRPPIESSELEVTASSIRALQVYAPHKHRAVYDRAIQRGAEWLAQAHPSTTEDRAFQLLGLKWTGRSSDAIDAASRALVAQQRPDGGWSQLPSLSSDAYATGQALVALIESGAITTADAPYKRGAQFLLNQQLADGSWFVRSRAIALQPHFESDFPHGRDQFISAAATNWAAMALAQGLN